MNDSQLEKNEPISLPFFPGREVETAGTPPPFQYGRRLNHPAQATVRPPTWEKTTRSSDLRICWGEHLFYVRPLNIPPADLFSSSLYINLFFWYHLSPYLFILLPFVIRSLTIIFQHSSIKFAFFLGRLEEGKFAIGHVWSNTGSYYFLLFLCKRS